MTGRARKVKKLKRLMGRSVVHGQHSGAGGVPVLFLGDRHHRGSAQRGRYGLGAHAGLRHKDGGSRAAGPERISGHRKPHPERPAERPADALGRPSEPRSARLVIAWVARFSARCNRRSAGHDPGVVPQAGRPYIL